MTQTPNATAVQVGMWNTKIAADAKKFQSINRLPVDITNDQMVQLYLLVYPFITTDFVHRSDLQKWAQVISQELSNEIEKLNNQINTLKLELDRHVHIGNLGAPTSPVQELFTKPQLSMWKAKPEDQQFKYGESLITDTSKYSSNSTHRLPTADASNTSTKLKISVLFDKQLKFVPFDENVESRIAEPNVFSNTGI